MPRVPLHYLVGLFAMFTIGLAGAAVGRILRLTDSDGAYSGLLILGFAVWLVVRIRYRP